MMIINPREQGCSIDDPRPTNAVQAAYGTYCKCKERDSTRVELLECTGTGLAYCTENLDFKFKVGPRLVVCDGKKVSSHVMGARDV
eukprot:scaffold48654_cov51-Attheya_sp.AAC.2